MKLYLDASALVPLFVAEVHTKVADQALAGNILIVSDFAAAEFSSAIARRARMGEVTTHDAAAAFSAFDAWSAKAAQRESLDESDVRAAAALVRRLELGLRTPDAINLVVAQRCAATMLTFDAKMAAAARALGLTLAN